MWDNKTPKVYIYRGGYKLIKNSGVGSAILHQTDMLKLNGIRVNEESFFKSDVIHFNTILPDSPLVALIARISGKKVVYYGHSTMEDFKNSFIGSNTFAGLFKAWIKFCYNLGDVVVTPTAYSKKILENYGIKSPVINISNGIDSGFWKYNKEERENDTLKGIFRNKYDIPLNKKVIMSVGHYIERKGIVEFIQVARNNPEYTFVWFGYTNLNLVPENVKTAIMNAPRNVLFPGYVDRENLKKAYQYCDLFLFMSHEETEGIVVLEALSMGIPTIVRDIPVYQGWLEDDINIYKYKDENELDLMIQYVLGAQDDSVIVQGRKTAKERDYISIGRKICEMYRDYL